MFDRLGKVLSCLACIALVFVLAGSAALLVGCSRESEEAIQDVGEEAGEAAETIGEDIQEGAEDAAEEADEALEDLDEEMQ